MKPLRAAAMALGLALLLMLGFIWFRFQLQFGLGAVLAVLHDVLLTLGVLAFTQVEFSMTSIAALLTVIGYSMNEKVITFDRLRENLRKYKTVLFPHTRFLKNIQLNSRIRVGRKVGRQKCHQDDRQFGRLRQAWSVAEQSSGGEHRLANRQNFDGRVDGQSER